VCNSACTTLVLLRAIRWIDVTFMHYSIFDTGALLASYDAEGDAIEALVALAAAQPARAGNLVFVAFDDEGRRVGEPVFGSYFLGD
jgi:hypothetical protein